MQVQFNDRISQLDEGRSYMVLDTGITPIDIMTARMRDEPLSNGRKVSDEQFAAAVAAAPYIHPKLAVQVVKNVDPKSVSPDAIESRVMELLSKGMTNAANADTGPTVDGVAWSDPERAAGIT
jgi:hypothetical protein